jgi:ATP-dependent metalloprotease FtsH
MGNYYSFSKQDIPKKNDIGLGLILVYLWFFYISVKIVNNLFNSKDEKKIKNKILDNIIGLESVKEEIRYYMDFINNKKKYKNWKVKLPKGILLAGPPGTGKTLLVKTMAKNLKIPIESVSGSQFVEKYVGVGASRVRNLFKKARRHKKCIIFIDEIDAVGRKRGFENNSERDSTLNQLLVEMDGFNETSNIIIFAATNLVNKLDPALIRSGRFDKKVYFDPPNFKERKDMYKLYLKNISLPLKLSYDILAERSAGLTGADISNICNQAKINAIQGKIKESSLRDEDLQEAIDEIMIGREKRERSMTKKERERVSYHEAGHTLVGYILKDCNQPIKVSIVPRGQFALGYSQQVNDNKKLYEERYILSKIAVLLGGRVAEKIIYSNISSGAADDIEKVSELIYNYTCVWGMNDSIGPLNPNNMGVISKNLNDSIFINCKNIIKNIEEFVFNLLKQNKKYIFTIGKELLKEETIDYNKIKMLLPNKLENSKIITIPNIKINL